MAASPPMAASRRTAALPVRPGSGNGNGNWRPSWPLAGSGRGVVAHSGARTNGTTPPARPLPAPPPAAPYGGAPGYGADPYAAAAPGYGAPGGFGGAPGYGGSAPLAGAVLCHAVLPNLGLCRRPSGRFLPCCPGSAPGFYVRALCSPRPRCCCRRRAWRCAAGGSAGAVAGTARRPGAALLLQPVHGSHPGGGRAAPHRALWGWTQGPGLQGRWPERGRCWSDDCAASRLAPAPPACPPPTQPHAHASLTTSRPSFCVVPHASRAAPLPPAARSGRSPPACKQQLLRGPRHGSCASLPCEPLLGWLPGQLDVAGDGCGARPAWQHAMLACGCCACRCHVTRRQLLWHHARAAPACPAHQPALLARLGRALAACMCELPAAASVSLVTSECVKTRPVLLALSLLHTHECAPLPPGFICCSGRDPAGCISRATWHATVSRPHVLPVRSPLYLLRSYAEAAARALAGASSTSRPPGK